MKLEWHINTFDELTVDEFHDILKLRVDVFVVEQDCPYEELDGKDRTAVHIYATNEEGRTMAYARIIPRSSEALPAIGRVVIDQAIRGTGAGHVLMTKCLQFLQDQYGDRASVLSAQDHLRSFYGKHGYQVASAVYDLDGIPHVDMKLEAT